MQTLTAQLIAHGAARRSSNCQMFQTKAREQWIFDESVTVRISIHSRVSDSGKTPVLFEASTKEAELLARLRSGEDRAFDELVMRAGPLLLALCRKMLSNEDDAQEAVQDTFLKALGALKDFDGRSQLTTWLHRIAVNNCLMKLRSRKLRAMKSLNSVEEVLPRFKADGHQQNPGKAWRRTVHEGIEQDELLNLVKAKIDELPEDYRTALVLRDVLGYDTAEVCRILDISESAAKTRLHRGRQALKELIGPWFQT